MKVSEQERRVIAAFELNADLKISDATKVTRLRDHSVRYHLSNLIERKLLRYYPCIDYHRLGFNHHGFCASFTPEGRINKREIFAALSNHPEVSWLAETGGEFDVALSVLSSNPLVMSNLLSKLNTKFGECIERKVIYSTTALSLFGAKFIYHPCPPGTPVRWEIEKLQEVPFQIDQLDKQILYSLVNDSYASLRDLGRKLQIPFSTLERRIALLKEANVITATIYLFNTEPLGVSYSKLLVQSRNLSPKFRSEFYEFCRFDPNVTALLETVGNWDYEICIENPNSKDLHRVQDELQKRFPKQIERMINIQIFNEFKISCFPFLETRDGNAKIPGKVISLPNRKLRSVG